MESNLQDLLSQQMLEIYTEFDKFCSQTGTYKTRNRTIVSCIPDPPTYSCTSVLLITCFVVYNYLLPVVWWWYVDGGKLVLLDNHL